MENSGHRLHLLKKTPVKIALTVIVSSLLFLGIFQLISLIGWPETVRWFFGTFVFIFVLLTGLFNILSARGPG
jgi:hypothetical protein